MFELLDDDIWLDFFTVGTCDVCVLSLIEFVLDEDFEDEISLSLKI